LWPNTNGFCLIHIAVDPVLIYLGPITLRWFNLASGLGLLVFTLVAIRQTKSLGLSSSHTYWIAVCGLLVGVPFGRLIHLADRWAYHIGSLRSILLFDIVSGIDYLGGLLGVIIAGYMYCRIRAIPPLLLANVLTPALILGQATGLLGVLINGDGAGNATILPWGTVYNHPAANLPSYLLGTPVHPLVAYQVILLMAVWAIGVVSTEIIRHPSALFAIYLCVTAIIYPLGAVLRPGGIQTSLKLAPLICAFILLSFGVALFRLCFKVKSRLVLEKPRQ
jgi:prolipoprotein diacylglyceryltransferase